MQFDLRSMAEHMGVAPERFLSLHQIHSPDVVVATGPWDGEVRPKADAIVTQAEGLAIGITTADCGPILFVDPRARVIGAAHAGWKGALTGVLESTIDAMEKLGADRTRMVAAIGPLIRQPSYEVGNEFVARFEEERASGFFVILQRQFRLRHHAGHDKAVDVREDAVELARLKQIRDKESVAQFLGVHPRHLLRTWHSANQIRKHGREVIALGEGRSTRHSFGFIP